VSDSARVRVERAIAELGLLPQRGRPGAEDQPDPHPGRHRPNITNPFFSELMRGIEDACLRASYSVFLCNGDDDRERQGRSLDTLQERRVDGVLLATPTGPAAALAKRLAGMKLKTVVVDRNIPGLEADHVRIDHTGGARTAVEHLLELGHRRIACLAGPSGFAASRARVAGGKKALERAGIEPRDEWLLEGDFSAPAGHDLTRALIDQRDDHRDLRRATT
jgi:LacI family transcriptional regulator